MELKELNKRLAKSSIGMVYKMEELDDVVSDRTPSQLVRMTKNNFDLNDGYFEFDGYGNLKSYEELEDVLDLYDDIQ